MRITEKQLDELIAIYKKDTGQNISREEAYKLGEVLVRLVTAVYKPQEH